jgi:hypothetical protein
MSKKTFTPEQIVGKLVSFRQSCAPGPQARTRGDFLLCDVLGSHESIPPQLRTGNV